MRASLLMLLLLSAACVPRPAERDRLPSDAGEEALYHDAGSIDAVEPIDAAEPKDAAAILPDAANEDAAIEPEDAGPAFEPGTLEVAWIHGSADCDQNTDPPIQVHAYNANTFILRQNKCIHFEAPFIYLLFGEAKVFMQDTGATSAAAAFPLRDAVEQVIAAWLGARGRDTIELVVTHSHAHGDHVAADAQFAGQPNTTVVGTGIADVSSFFGIATWPDQEVSYDLGGRTLDVLAIPGHQTSHLAIYDRQTGLLLTGDTLYPGRLYISDWDAYRASIERLASFAGSRFVAHVLGTHVEMSDSAGVDYPIGSTHQPNEHVLQLELSHLIELRDALRTLGAEPQREVHDSFIITPL